MEKDITSEFGEVVTVENAIAFWSEWFGPYVGWTIVGVELVQCDQEGTVPALKVQQKKGGRFRWIPLNEDPEGVMGTASRVGVKIPDGSRPLMCQT